MRISQDACSRQRNRLGVFEEHGGLVVREQSQPGGVIEPRWGSRGTGAGVGQGWILEGIRTCKDFGFDSECNRGVPGGIEVKRADLFWLRFLRDHSGYCVKNRPCGAGRPSEATGRIQTLYDGGLDGGVRSGHILDILSSLGFADRLDVGLEREGKTPPRFWAKSQLPLTEMGKVVVTFWGPSASPAKSRPAWSSPGGFITFYFYQNGLVCSRLWWNFPQRALALTLQTNQLLLIRLMYGLSTESSFRVIHFECLFSKCMYAYI